MALRDQLSVMHGDSQHARRVATQSRWQTIVPIPVTRKKPSFLRGIPAADDQEAVAAAVIQGPAAAAAGEHARNEAGR